MGWILVNSTLRDMVPKQIIRPMNNISAHSVIFRYNCRILRGKGMLSVLTCAVDRRVVFDMREAGSGPYIFNAVCASLTVTDVFFSSLEFKILMYYRSVGLPIIT